jgi:hypothetical protein
MSQMQLPSGVNMNATDFSAVVNDINGAPTTVIRKEQDFAIECEWYLQGPDAPNTGARWKVRVALESIGPGTDFVVTSPNSPIPYTQGTLSGPAGNRRVTFAENVRLPNGLTLLPAGETERSYHVTALLTSRDQFNSAPTSYAAMYDLGVITIFDSEL